MCVACGIATHIPVAAAPTVGRVAPAAKFAALRHADCRAYLVGAMLSMMADNVEHVISYWVLFQVFASPALAGFAVISHWVPSLLFSMYFGKLADRQDCRKVIQVSQVMYMAVSAGWGFLFLTNSLQVWHAVVLLTIHGLAGALWSPAEQLMLHDIVGSRELLSAVRLNSTARSLGILCGPAVGSALLLFLGPSTGIFVNILIYLPLTVWLLRVKYTGHLHAVETPRAEVGLGNALSVLREVTANPTVFSMVAIAGVSSLFVSGALSPQMPEFARDLGAGQAGLAYAVLLAANAGGAVFGGLVLEGTGLLKATPRMAIAASFVWGASMLGFAVTGNYVAAVLLLLLAGIAQLASQSIGQTLVQLRAPADRRGQVVGVYNMAARGLQAGSGVTVGIVGSLIGIHWSLALSATALCIGAFVVLAYVMRAQGSPEPAISVARSRA